MDCRVPCAPTAREATLTGPFVPFAVAALLSLSWIAAFVALVLPGAEEAGLAAMAPVDIASMMAAAIVPVGILWLCAAAGSALAVIRADRRAAPAGAQARRTEDIDTIARTLVLLEEQARRRAFLEGLDLTLKDMSSHLALLMRRLGMIEREEVETLWALYAAGNPWAFPEMLLIRMGSPGPAVVRALAERLANDSPSAAALQRFLRRHAMVCRLSQDQGEDKLLGEILTDGPLGQVAGLLDSVNQRLPGQTPAAEIAPGRAADPAEAPSRPAVPPPFTGPSTQSAPAPSPVPTQAAPRPAAPAAPQ
ncbi:hypothetical protein CCR92_00880, partial [Rhodospirillum rubrum]|nr:hypothetical protein [Rhodospirillum rubrum]